MPDKTIFRHDYQPYPFSIESIHLSFELFEQHTEVHCQLKLYRTHPGELRLYGDALSLQSIQLNGKPLEKTAFHFQGDDLLIPQCPNEFTLDTVVRLHPQDNTALSGLYRSNQLFCTQCEAEGFRRITYFPDRPDVLTRYTTRITADKTQFPILLSNGNLIDHGDLTNGRHFVVWDDPFKKPSYLFALVAGDLACVRDQFVTQSGRTVDLRLYVEHGNENQCDHAMASLKRAMHWDEQEYGREYDLDIFMIVAVSDFNMGAMENKGLNIFNSKYILAHPETATDQDYIDIEEVVGHEYFHNWTGNRVTCRDWFQLSLKEGLTVFRDQSFSADMNSADVSRIANVKTLINAQFPEDAGSMAHPVRPESYQEINNFYTATIYNKGAEVIRMQHTLLGKNGFRRGMDLYFERHDGHAVTIDDFVAAMEDANQVDLTPFKRWYSQAGTPEVRVTRDYQAGRLTLTLSQSCRPTPECTDKQPFHIPIRIALLDAHGQTMPIQNDLLELKETTQTFYFEGLPSQPIVSLLRHFSAPVKLIHTQNDTELLTILRHETDGYAKWNAGQTLAINTLLDQYNQASPDGSISTSLLEAYRQVLGDDHLDPALRAELLITPSFEEVAAELANVDVSRIEAIRDAFRLTLSQTLFSQAETMYETLWKREQHALNQTANAQRKLRNACLWLMMKSNNNDALPYCEQQFNQAKTMTDAMASFALLVNGPDESLRQRAIEQFYQRWSHHDLVMDKWFAVQATSEASNTLQHVRGLLEHPQFQFTNPNKVRAVIGAFAQLNPRHFHAIDGQGYAFLTEMLLKIDPINPQIAARLATPFTRWQRLNAPRQALMQAQLRELSQNSLSNDLQEVVNKSLSS